MNWVDIGFLILVGGGGLFGYVTGFLNQIGRLIGVFSAVYGSIHFHLPVTRWLKTSVDQPFAGLLSYIILFLVIYLGCLGIVKLMDRVLYEVNLKEEDRQLGAVLGVLKGVLISAMLLLGFAVYPGNTVARDIDASYTGKPLLFLSRTLVVQIPNEVRKRIDRTMDRMRNLPAPRSRTPDSRPSPSTEQPSDSDDPRDSSPDRPDHRRKTTTVHTSE